MYLYFLNMGIVESWLSGLRIKHKNLNWVECGNFQYKMEELYWIMFVLSVFFDSFSEFFILFY